MIAPTKIIATRMAEESLKAQTGLSKIPKMETGYVEARCDCGHDVMGYSFSIRYRGMINMCVVKICRICSNEK